MRKVRITIGVLSSFLLFFGGISHSENRKAKEVVQVARNINQSTIRLSTADTVAWEVGMMNLAPDNEYQSPLLMDSLLILTSKTVFGKREGKVLSLPVRKTSLLSFVPSRERYEAATPIKDILFERYDYKLKKLANVFEGSDNKVDKRTRFAEVKRRMYVSSLQFIGEANLKYDAMHLNAFALAVDQNRHVYYPLNSTFGTTEKTIRLCEGDYVDRKIINTGVLSFEDGKYYSGIQPTVNQQGDLIVFSSCENNARGDYDLYWIKKRDKQINIWSVPTKVPVVNTSGDELYPNITADGYLYYSSDNMPQGEGGLDIYRIKLNDLVAGKHIIEHLASPINTAYNDYGWTQYDSTDEGYFISDRLEGLNEVYRFNRFDYAICRGKVVDDVDEKEMPNLPIYICDRDRMIAKAIETNKQGNFSFQTARGHNVVIRAMGYVRTLSPGKQSQKELGSCIEINNIRKGVEMDTLLLQQEKLSEHDGFTNTFVYESGKSALDAPSLKELDYIASLLLKHANFRVEITAYGDRGKSFDANCVLAQQRADVLTDYLRKRGVKNKQFYAETSLERTFVDVSPSGFPTGKTVRRVNQCSKIKMYNIDNQVMVSASIIDNTKTNVKLNVDMDVDKFPEGFFDK